MNRIILLLALAVLAACSPAKKATTAVETPAPAKTMAGNWTAVIAGTPMGDIPGEMVLTQNGEGYTGYFLAGGERMDLSNLKVEGNKISASFYARAYQTDAYFTATWDAATDTMEGWVMDSFKLTGKRKEAAAAGPEKK